MGIANSMNKLGPLCTVTVRQSIAPIILLHTRLIMYSNTRLILVLLVLPVAVPLLRQSQISFVHFFTRFAFLIKLV